MSRKASASRGRTSRRKITLLWIAALFALIITLIVLEQTAMLYVLATLGLTGLLLVVAVADLSGARRALTEPAPADDAAAIGTGISSTMRPTATATNARRPAPRASKRV
jgi:hypothetical protein